ncbi:MAG: FAD-binding oxidoreductase [Actinobacteria bacterium]|nr:FAD-binding oxidoreductase [Actinomycetota bacterium]
MIDTGTLDVLRKQFSGEIVDQDHADYDAARRVWNGMIDRRPAAVARASSVEDVVAAVTFARERDVLLSVRCGAHSGPGFSTCDGGLVLDLRAMKEVRVDPDRRTATVAGGALLGDLDRASQAHGLATTAGVVSHTGVAGLTLGGGFGRLQRKHGLTIDNLLSVEVVTAAGEILRASEDENTELFWGLRGAGHNFGVATSFEFRLHPVGPNVLAGMAAYPIEQSDDIVGAYRQWSASLGDDIISGISFMTMPPSMPFPSEIAGRKVVQVIAMHVDGDPDRSAELEPVTKFASPLFEMIVPLPYVMLQAMADDAFAWGQRNYVKGGYLTELGDDVAELAAAAVTNAPGPRADVAFLQMGGAIGRVPEDATAFTGRNAAFLANIENVWTDPNEDARHAAWTRETNDALSKHFTAGNYVNIVEDPDADSRAIYGGPKYARLRALKKQYDPTNLFRLNQNIVPA